MYIGLLSGFKFRCMVRVCARGRTTQYAIACVITDAITERDHRVCVCVYAVDNTHTQKSQFHKACLPRRLMHTYTHIHCLFGGCIAGLLCMFDSQSYYIPAAPAHMPFYIITEFSVERLVNIRWRHVASAPSPACPSKLNLEPATASPNVH